MYYFHMVPKEYAKYLFVLKDVSKKTQETLGEYYIRINRHLIPNDVRILEYDPLIEKVNELVIR